MVTIAGAVVVGGALLYVGYRLGDAGEETPPPAAQTRPAPDIAAGPDAVTGRDIVTGRGDQAPDNVVVRQQPAGDRGEEAVPEEDMAGVSPPDQDESATAPALSPEGPRARDDAGDDKPARPAVGEEAQDDVSSASVRLERRAPAPAPSLSPQTGDAAATRRTPYAWATASDVGYRLDAGSANGTVRPAPPSEEESP